MDNTTLGLNYSDAIARHFTEYAGSNPALPKVVTMNENTNYEGGPSFESSSAKLRLYKTVINNLLEDTYYADTDELEENVMQNLDLVADEDPEFVLKLAAYARQEMGLRDIPQLLLAFAANDDRFKTKPPEPNHHEDTMVRDYVPEIVRRLDETVTVREMNDKFAGGDPRCLRKGVSDAIKIQENEYLLGKYANRGDEYNLKDIFNWSHPDPSLNRVSNNYNLTESEISELHERFMLGDLDNNVNPIETPNTWRTIISEKGDTKEAWREAMDNMGHMAKIMNLRNLIEAGIPGTDIISESDVEAAKTSNMFPFRYYSAYRALQNANLHDEDVYRFLEDAVQATAENVPDAFGDSFVVADTSGSMSNTSVSGRSNRTPHEIAGFLAAVLNSKGADVAAFADDVEEIGGEEAETVLEMTDVIRNAGPGGRTNAYKVLKRLCEEDRKYKRVILLTDGQFWDSTYESDHTVKAYWDEYTADIYPKANLYNIDLSSYGNLSIPEDYKDVYRINGWNERVLEFIVNAERPNEVIQEVESYDPIE